MKIRRKFSLDDWLRDPKLPVITKDGHRVNILKWDCEGDRPICGLIKYDNDVFPQMFDVDGGDPNWFLSLWFEENCPDPEPSKLDLALKDMLFGFMGSVMYTEVKGASYEKEFTEFAVRSSGKIKDAAMSDIDDRLRNLYDTANGDTLKENLLGFAQCILYKPTSEELDRCARIIKNIVINSTTEA